MLSHPIDNVRQKLLGSKAVGGLISVRIVHHGQENGTRRHQIVRKGVCKLVDSPIGLDLPDYTPIWIVSVLLRYGTTGICNAEQIIVTVVRIPRYLPGRVGIAGEGTLIVVGVLDPSAHWIDYGRNANGTVIAQVKASAHRVRNLRYLKGLGRI